MRLMEALCGVGPVAERLGAWLDAHPAAAAAVMLLGALACATADALALGRAITTTTRPPS